MHTRGVEVDAARLLPAAGPERYLEQLRAGRERILRCLDAWPFEPQERGILESVVACCDALEERWPRIEDLCDGLPETLVHCDFQPKNAFVRSDPSGLGLWPIDWEMAGFGVPAADLTRIDLRAYWSTIRPHWPHVGLDAVERLARAGNVLQLAAAVDWLSVSLDCELPRDRSAAVEDLELSTRRRLESARAAGVLDSR